DALAGGTLDRAAATSAAQAQGKGQAGAAAKPQAAVAAVASGINGSGLVFDPDPRTVLNTDSLTDTSPASAFDAAYSTKSLLDLTVTAGVYKLTGPYVNIK